MAEVERKMAVLEMVKGKSVMVPRKPVLDRIDKNLG